MNDELYVLLKNNRMPHAMVIDGGSYDKRLKLAKTLAMSMLCESHGEKPCEVCASCKKILSGSHPDVIVVSPEDKKKTISVEVIRNMRDDAYIMPNESERKIYIIDRAELMQEYAQNALLKVLEEPPVYVNFILLCESKSILLDTVLSRVAAFSLDTELSDEADDEKLKEALVIAVGIADALITKNEMKLISKISVFEKNYDILPLVLDSLDLILRDALVISSGGTNLISNAGKQAENLSRMCTNEQLFALINALRDISLAINIYSNKNLTLTRLGSRLMAAINA